MAFNSAGVEADAIADAAGASLNAFFLATIAVVCGQIYVASGYRSLAEALKLSLL